MTSVFGEMLVNAVLLNTEQLSLSQFAESFGVLMFKEQREDELMVRQNLTEHAFESDDNDSKSDAAAELNFDSNEASEHVRILSCCHIFCTLKGAHADL